MLIGCGSVPKLKTLSILRDDNGGEGVPLRLKTYPA